MLNISAGVLQMQADANWQSHNPDTWKTIVHAALLQMSNEDASGLVLKVVDWELKGPGFQPHLQQRSISLPDAPSPSPIIIIVS